MRLYRAWWPRIGPLPQRKNRIDHTTGLNERGGLWEISGSGRVVKSTKNGVGRRGDDPSTERLRDKGGRVYREEGRNEERSLGGRFYNSRPVIGSGREATGAYTTTPGVAEGSVDEGVSRELGVPVAKSAVGEYGGKKDDGPVIVERSSYERLPHESVVPGMVPDDGELIEKEGTRMEGARELKEDEGFHEGGLKNVVRKLGMIA